MVFQLWDTGSSTVLSVLKILLISHSHSRVYFWIPYFRVDQYIIESYNIRKLIYFSTLSNQMLKFRLVPSYTRTLSCTFYAFTNNRMAIHLHCLRFFKPLFYVLKSLHTHISISATNSSGLNHIKQNIGLDLFLLPI